MKQSHRQLLYALGLALLAVADIPEGTDASGWMTIASLVAAAAVVRRAQRPAAMVLVGFAAMFTADVIAGVGDTATDSTTGHAITLGVLVYALCRHAPWRDVVVALAAAAVLGALGEAVTEAPDWSLKLDDVWVWIIGALAGVAVRYRAALHETRAERIRSEERARIARDLHDVIAHHVSAISLHAEGAAAVIDTDTDSARAALGAIHGAATTAMTEMRRMVAILRDDNGPGERSPSADIGGLAAEFNDPLQPIPVAVTIDESLGDVPATTTSAVLRIAREAVTNARRHGRGASTIDVVVERAADSVILVVDDDGEHHPGPRQGGYGVQGMTERATLLGGTLTATPRDGRGWRVRASIPVDGAPR